MTTEVWKVVPGYRKYEASDAGRVRSTKTRRVLRPYLNPQLGYYFVALMKDDGSRAVSMLVHRIVLATFAGVCPSGMECRHLNGVRNDNRISNLAWGTSKENSADCMAHGTLRRGESHHTARLTALDVRQIRWFWSQNHPLIRARAIAAMYGITEWTVYNIMQGKSWSSVPVEPDGGPFPEGEVRACCV